MLKRLKLVRGLTDAEKSVYALGLAATPEERWELAENFIRSLGRHPVHVDRQALLKVGTDACNVRRHDIDAACGKLS